MRVSLLSVDGKLASPCITVHCAVLQGNPLECTIAHVIFVSPLIRSVTQYFNLFCDAPPTQTSRFLLLSTGVSDTKINMRCLNRIVYCKRMTLHFRWGLCPHLAGGCLNHSIASILMRSANLQTQASTNLDQQEHLQRSLDLGPAAKQAPDFEYLTVAFRSHPRTKRSRAKKRGSIERGSSDALTNIFGDSKEGHGFRTLEMVSGDRRLLFEVADDTAQNKFVPTETPSQGELSAINGLATDSSGRSDRTRGRRQARRVKQPIKGLVSTLTSGFSSVVSDASSTQPIVVSTAAPTMAPGARRGGTEQVKPPEHAVASSFAVADSHITRDLSTASPNYSASGLSASTSTGQPLSFSLQPRHLSPPQQQQQMCMLDEHRKTACAVRKKSAASARPAAHSTNADRLAAAAALLQLPLHKLRKYWGFCSELRAVELTPADLSALCCVLVQLLGLAPPQLCAVLLNNPRVLRVPPAVAARRGAALALELHLPPPPGPGGGGPLAAIIAAEPAVLLRRSEFTGTTAALAAALALPPSDALALLRQEPQLLRHPPGVFAHSVGQLREQMGLTEAAAAALAAAEPQLLAVSPGVLCANGAMLRSLLQLSPQQLAEIVARAPEILVRSPGELRVVVQRLTTVLSRSSSWREGLPRLLASSRNLAVALSFGSDRYDRLQYLAATGRDRIMGFKEGLSLKDEDFKEVFPEYVYNVWQQAVHRPQLQLRRGQKPYLGVGSAPMAIQVRSR